METFIVKNNKNFEILTPYGWSDFDGITKTIKKGLIQIITNNNDVLKCTFEHKILCDNNIFIDAKQLKIGDKIYTKNGISIIINIEIDENYENYVYDAKDVEKNNVYYTNDIISHNCVEFLGSSGTLIAGWKLKELTYELPLYEHNGIRQYKKSVKNNIYVCIVDVSRGKGLDYSAFQIINVTQMPYEQVCTFRDNMTTPADYASIIHTMCKTYNNASVMVELNDIGGQVADALHFEFEYEHIIYTENNGRSGKRVSGGFKNNVDRGLRTTKNVKSVGCSMLKLLIEQNQLLLYDHNTIHELKTFSQKFSSYEAEPGCHDDLVMCLVLFGWLSDQNYFRHIVDINTLMELRDKSENELFDELVPFGFMEGSFTDNEEPVIDNKGDYWVVVN